ncbi:MAG: hypothetical protein KR126chlam2_00107 [Chlamydiae bacterium]|nr:hypothetical protein [Chlamydiota bacterium]
MYILQFQLEVLKKKLEKGKVIVIYGPRRVGKTTLLNHFLEGCGDYLFVSGEDVFVHDYLSSQSIEKLRDFVGDKQLLVIDEAQKISNIGINLKLLVDHFPSLSIIATGSSTFDLARKVGEPLTGRKKVLQIFPLAQIEMGKLETPAQTRANLEKRLIFGSYPEVVLLSSDNDKKEYLHELVRDYLYRDILEYEGIKKSKKIIELLQLIALQIGKEVSYSELATRLGLGKATVEKYLDLLEQVFVLINIRGFSRNLRSEITKTSRYYFCDLGIRNALINNFNFFSVRNDVGEVWENYLIMERLKKQHYHQIYANNYFWRTYDQKEIDWIEESEGELHGFEFKWKNRKVKAPALWQKTYPESTFEVISQDNYLDFIT